MKRIILSFALLLLFALNNYGQMTLEMCKVKMQANYPLIKQYDLLEKTREYSLDNVAKGNLPQVSLSSKATYQSEVTKLPIQIPNVNIKEINKDQYQVMVEVKQNLWDGGEMKSQKELTNSSITVNREKVNVDMYALNERINQLYFGILLLDEQLKQNQLLQDDLGQSYQRIEAFVKNGIAHDSDLDEIRVEQLNTKQKKTALMASRQAYLQMLSQMIGENIAPGIPLEKPAKIETPSADSDERPELQWFDAQNALLQTQQKALDARVRPHFGLFAQGAYGNPGLNMLKNKFTPYYTVGVKLTWNFGSLYTLHNDRSLLENSRQQQNVNKDVFLFNTRLEATQENNSITSMRKQMEEDDEIIRLRSNIRKSAEAKVANGTLSVIEMLRQIDAESLARQTKSTHEIELLLDIYQLKYITNK